MKLNVLILVSMLASLSTTSATQRLRHTAAAPAPPADCSTLVMDNMITCMQFLSTTGTETKPDADCCSGLKVVMKTNADCLCYAIKSAPSMGLDLNLTRAGEMPSDCGIHNAPPISKCTAADTPTPTPAPAPAPAPANPPNLPPAAQPPAQVPSSSPSPSPAPSNPKSGASSISATFSVIFIQLIYISIFFALA